MMSASKEDCIKFVQFNAAGRFVTHDLFMMWLASATKPIIACIQEPCIKKQGFLRLPKDFTSFWSNKPTKYNDSGIKRSTSGLRVNAPTTKLTGQDLNNRMCPNGGKISKKERIWEGVSDSLGKKRVTGKRKDRTTNLIERVSSQKEVTSNNKRRRKDNVVSETGYVCVFSNSDDNYLYTHKKGCNKCNKGVKRGRTGVDGSEGYVNKSYKSRKMYEKGSSVNNKKQQVEGNSKSVNWECSRRRGCGNSRRIKNRSLGFESGLINNDLSTYTNWDMSLELSPFSNLDVNHLYTYNKGRNKCNKGIKREKTGIDEGEEYVNRSYKRRKMHNKGSNEHNNEHQVDENSKTVNWECSRRKVCWNRRRIKNRSLGFESESIKTNLLTYTNWDISLELSPVRCALRNDESVKWGDSKNRRKLKYSSSINRKSQRIRALIIASKCLIIASNADCVTVRFNDLQISVMSVYCDINVEIERSMHEVCKEQMYKSNLIVCADTNARCIRWGVSGNRNKSFKSYFRGDQVSEHLDELDLVVCNTIPHPPTFVGDSGFSSHIDATFCSSMVVRKIRDWRVSSEQFESDHRVIRFEFYMSNSLDFNKVKQDSHGTPWLRPSEKMMSKMKECLPKMIKFQRRICNMVDVDMFVQKHSKEVHEALQRLYKRNKGNRQSPCYWWTKEVEYLHKCLKIAKRRMFRYKFENLKSEYNLCRKRFRNKVKEAKITAWKEFTSNITDPWKGLMKILSRENINKAQERTLCSTDGVYANNLTDTLLMLSEQFYPKPVKYSVLHKQMEEEVSERLAIVKCGESITVCEFRKALSEMKKATAPGKDCITNCVLQILAKECCFEGVYIKLFNVCLREGAFPQVWKQAKIILIPKAVDMIDSAKAMRLISLMSMFSKLLERIVLARILHYVELLGKLSLSQHAYRKGGSTTTALFEAAKFMQDIA